MERHERIARAIELSGKRKGEIAAACGVAPSSVTQWISGESKSLKPENLFALAKATGFAAQWLGIGEGPEREQIDEHGNIAPALQPHRSPKHYPLISWVAAGERAESPDNHCPGDGEEMIESTENAGLYGYWLTVKGLSMKSDGTPSFPEGIKILVRPEGFDVISGKFYIAKHRDGETTFKQYVRDAGTEYLVPLNPTFKTVEMDGEWRLIGRVVDAKITGL
ncbi:LexA family transcriptional regulator [Pseudomonas sp. F(2018)]|uniref:LexA family protein n=1 Tax=Pseudomonas sp. F(2018) TaxID=2502240 RepID=UPI001484FFF2|nr:XRE family transcriptional regulator [Pseudomonas sp. F(2018)]